MKIDTQNKYDINEIVTSLNSQVIDIIEDKEPKKSFFEILKNKNIDFETNELEKKAAISGNAMPPSWESNITSSPDTQAISINEIEVLLNSNALELIGQEKFPVNTQPFDDSKQVSYNSALRFMNHFMSEEQVLSSKLDPAFKESILGLYDISNNLAVKNGLQSHEHNSDQKLQKITIRNLTENRKVILGEFNQLNDVDSKIKEIDPIYELSSYKTIDKENNFEKHNESHIDLGINLSDSHDVMNQNYIESELSIIELGGEENQRKRISTQFSSLQEENLVESVTLNQKPEYYTENDAIPQMLRVGAFAKNETNLKNNNPEVRQVESEVIEDGSISKSLEDIDVLSKELYSSVKPYLENINVKVSDRKNPENVQIKAKNNLERIDAINTISVKDVSIESDKISSHFQTSYNFENYENIVQTGFTETRFLDIDLSNYKIDSKILESDAHQINRDIYNKLSSHLGLEVTNLVQRKVDGRYKITMSLYPEDLGTIEMDVEYSAKQGIHINLVGENGRVSQIFQENLHLLKQSFQNNSGLELDITLGHRSDDSANDKDRKSRENSIELSDSQEPDKLVKENSRIITAKSNRIDKLV